MKQFIWFGLFVVTGLIWLCICNSPSGPPPNVSSEQIHVVNTQLQLLQEQVAACRSPSSWLILAFIVSTTGPVLLTVLLLHHANHATIHTNELFRQMNRYGLTSEIIDTARLLEEPHSETLPPKVMLPQASPREIVRSQHKQHDNESVEQTNDEKESE